MFNFVVNFFFRDSDKVKVAIFLKNLSWSLMGTVGGSLLLFIANVLFGRAAGPVEYGKYSLFLAVTNILYVFVFMGLDTLSVKYISGSDNTSEKDGYLTNSLILVAVASIILLAVSGFISPYIYRMMPLMWFSVMFVIVLSLKNILDSFVKAHKRFALQSLIKLSESILVLVPTLFLLAEGKLDFKNYFLVVVFSSTISVFVYFYVFYRNIKGWNRQLFNNVKRYFFSSYSVAIVGCLVANVDRIVINSQIGAKELGLFSAYLMSSTMVVSQIMTAISNVVFPEASSSTNYKKMRNKLASLSKIGFLPIVLLISLSSTLIVLILGKEYGLNYWFVLIVSLTGYFQILSTLYGVVVMSSEDMFRKASKVYYFKPLFILCMYVIYMIFLRDVGIIFFFLMVMFSYLYDLLNSYIILQRFNL